MCKPHKQNNYGERAATKREAKEEIDEQDESYASNPNGKDTGLQNPVLRVRISRGVHE